MGVRSLELQIVISAVRAEVVVHGVVVGVENRPERVGAVRLLSEMVSLATINTIYGWCACN